MSQFMISFRSKTPPDWVLDGLRQGDISSFCLFAYNVSAPAQLRELTGALHGAAREGGQPPPLIGIDQEGGQLMAVTGGATELPGSMALGATRSPELAERAGRVLGLELLALGCNLNFAPVLDLSQNPDNPVIGVRAFSDDPALAGELGRAMIRGMQSVGVLATAKHFPGHGDTAIDSHHATPVVERSLEELKAKELEPFRAAITEGVGAVMAAHVRYPALDSAPATLSRRILKDLLRRDLSFEGLIITDAMDMQALAHLGDLERNEAALKAGADLLLFGHLPEQATLMRALRPLLEPRAVARIGRVRERLPRELPSPDIIGCAEHRRVAQEIADASITVLRGRLPLKLEPEARLAVITVQAGDLTPADTSSGVTVRLAEAVRRRHANTLPLTLPHLASPKALREVLEVSASADAIVVGTINAGQDPSQVELIRALRARGQNPVVVALRGPYDLRAFPFVDSYLCAYGIRDANTEAAAKVLFGEIEAQGRLPCRLDGLEEGAPV